MVIETKQQNTLQQHKAGNPCEAACSHCAGNARTQKLLELFQMSPDFIFFRLGGPR